MGSNAILVFRESSDFFDMMDKNIKRGNSVTIRFNAEKPNQNSKLWKRLSKTQNWGVVKGEFEKIKNNQSTPMSSIIAPDMRSSLTGGELLLIAWVSTLIAGITVYAIYKGRRIRIKVSGKKGDQDGDGEIVIE
ncbi:TPA: hypothetical protein RQJ54_000116 [Vibrio vulnificus]|nr:hypothetical protein [Vibrio parahaemolyticus]HDY7522256.1 hypothetical protein [Vibrio vulnificus]